jgi:hypothetical protein
MRDGRLKPASYAYSLPRSAKPTTTLTSSIGNTNGKIDMRTR